MVQQFRPEIWGPHYWFFLHTIAHAYPENPNSVTKRKYYDLIQNMPLFIPVPEIGDKFSKMLDKYPVSPYLDHRDSIIRWVHFIHNKMNHELGKEEVSLFQSMDLYNAEYKPKQVVLADVIQTKDRYIHLAIFFILLFLIYVFY